MHDKLKRLAERCCLFFEIYNTYYARKTCKMAWLLHNSYIIGTIHYLTVYVEVMYIETRTIFLFYARISHCSNALRCYFS
jgi:hypothetical protein